MFHRFILNGLLNANDILGEEVFDIEDWKVIGEYVYDNQGGRHQAFYSPKRDFSFRDIHIKAGERVQVEQSLKYSPREARQLWERSGLDEIAKWSASSEKYSEYDPYFAHMKILLLQIKSHNILPMIEVLCNLGIMWIA